MTFSETPASPTIKAKLVKTFLDQRVSHAQLFHGCEGSGKLALAIAYAQLLNCTNPRHASSSVDACGTCPSCLQYQKFAHPDLHFFFPTATSKAVPSKPSSKHYLGSWREFLLSTDCQVSLPAWYEFIGIENKQGTIYADDATEINHILGYKSYESEFKIIIIWMIEKLNFQAAPKILKILEEPPEKTLFLLLSDNPELVFPTILSRCLPVKIPRVPEPEIRSFLIRKTACSPQAAQAASMASAGNIRIARLKLHQEEEDLFCFDSFRTWMRLCFSHNVPALISFATGMGKTGREKQKSLLHYGLQVAEDSIDLQFRQQQPLTAGKEEQEFILRFAPFLTTPRLPRFYDLLNSAIHHVERNAHAPTLFLDLSLKISRLIKQ